LTALVISLTRFRWIFSGGVNHGPRRICSDFAGALESDVDSVHLADRM